MFCTKCGAQMREGNSFCTKCGARNDAQIDPTLLDQTMPVRLVREPYSAPARPVQEQYNALARPAQEQYSAPVRPAREQYSAPVPPKNAGNSRGNRRLVIILICVVLAVIVAAACLVFLLLHDGGEDESTDKALHATASDTTQADITQEKPSQAAPSEDVTEPVVTPSQAPTEPAVTPDETMPEPFASEELPTTEDPQPSTSGFGEYVYYGDYLIAGSDSRYITETDIAWMTARDMQMAINEIYARNGRIFNSPEIRAYFESKYWYHGSILPDDFTEAILNEYERANVAFLLEHRGE